MVPWGSGAATPGGALRAIDSSARPRSWRTLVRAPLAAISAFLACPRMVVLWWQASDQIDQRLTRLRMDNSAKPSRTGPVRRSAIRSNFPQPVNHTSLSPIQSVLFAAYSTLPQTDAGEG